MHLDLPPIFEREETVPFVWPNANQTPNDIKVESYIAEIIEDKTAFEKVQELIGWHVTEDQWQLLSEEIVTKSMVLITHKAEPVAVACGLSRPNNWVELAWVAVVPAHRGRGLGKLVCSEVVKQLVDLGRPKVFGSTQDERLSAIKIYLDIGFYPLYRKNKFERWASICRKLNKPFTPSTWEWPIHG